MSEQPQEKKAQTWADSLPPTGQEETPANADTEQIYRDGSVAHECWSGNA